MVKNIEVFETFWYGKIIIIINKMYDTDMNVKRKLGTDITSVRLKKCHVI